MYLCAIEGMDACGKQTQTELICKRLIADGEDVRKISFPMYDKQSSYFVKQYLNGEYGGINDVDAYEVSTFFALDRYDSFKKDWGKDYNKGKLIISDRYIGSNMIYQAGRIKDMREKEKYLNWMSDLEYRVYGLPKANTEIFLHMPLEYSIEIMRSRGNKIDCNKSKDIHESNLEFLRDSYNNAMYIVDKYKWKVVECVSNGKLRSIGDINKDIYEIIKGDIKSRMV